MKTLKDYKPCKEAYDFYKEHNNFKDAWGNCPRGDWMLWIAYRLKLDKKLLILTSVKCARTVQHLMKDKRSTDALDVFEAYCNGTATIEEYNKAADATDVAAYAAYAADAADAAAYVAAYAADAADAADVADVAADAAYAAAYAAADAAYADADAARKTNQLKTADICRELLTKEVLKRIK